MLLLFSRAAPAADNSVAVLGIEATDGAPEAVAAALTDALRQRVSAEKAYRLVPGKDLVEVKLIFSCPDEAPSCMAEAAKNLNASKLIFGGVKKSAGDSFVVTLKLLDAGRKQVDAWVAEQITRAQTTGGAIRGPVQKWFATLTGQGMGVVRVKGDVPGTSVALDGAPMGVIGSDDLVLNNVTAGRHEILASKPGLAPVRKEVTVAAGATADVSVSMAAQVAAARPAPAVTPAAGQPPPPPPASPGVTAKGASPAVDEPPRIDATGTNEPRGHLTAMRAATWGTLLAGVASFGLAVKFGLDVRNINSDLDPYRRFQCASNVPASQAKFGCTLDGTPAQRALNNEENEYVKAQQDEGKKFQNLQYVAIGVGGAFVVASGVFFYLGYIADDGGVALLDRPRGPRLRLAPVVSGDGGGFSARLTF
jgi:hypothetical protein